MENNFIVAEDFSSDGLNIILSLFYKFWSNTLTHFYYQIAFKLQSLQVFFNFTVSVTDRDRP